MCVCVSASIRDPVCLISWFGVDAAKKTLPIVVVSLGFVLATCFFFIDSSCEMSRISSIELFGFSFALRVGKRLRVCFCLFKSLIVVRCFAFDCLSQERVIIRVDFFARV